MELVAMAVFALALSQDGFGAGVAYGVRRIKIPLVSMAVICLNSMVMISVSMLAGQVIARYLSPHVAGGVGAAMLVIMGAWVILQTVKPDETVLDGESATILSVRIRPLGIIIQIMSEPARADFDSSGEISTREAFFLGLALAMDALAAGLGVAMAAGYTIPVTALLVGAAEFLMVNAGLVLGRCAASGFMKTVSGVVSGLVLITLGVSKFF